MFALLFFPLLIVVSISNPTSVLAVFCFCFLCVLRSLIFLIRSRILWIHRCPVSIILMLDGQFAGAAAGCHSLYIVLDEGVAREVISKIQKNCGRGIMVGFV